MTQPPPFKPSYSFTDFASGSPASQPPGVKLDDQFNGIELTTRRIRENLALIQRDDGRLAPNSVGFDQLSAAAIAALKSASGQDVIDALADLANQTDAAVAQVSADRQAVETIARTGVGRVFSTWLALQPAAGMLDDGAIVMLSDTGTHTDPVTNLTVPNSGTFSYSTTPAGWRYIGPQVAQGNNGADSTVPGPSNNTRLSLALLKAAAITDKTSLYDGSPWYWTTGVFTGLADDINVVKADSTALTVGAWVRQQSKNVTTAQTLAGSVTRGGDAKLNEIVSVKDLGAKADGITDDTAAFNLATSASATHTGNDTTLKRLIKAPAGTYKINGTIYLHKGQQLVGDGTGATYLDLSTPTDNAKPSIKMGQSSGGAIDPGGLACEVAGIFTIGGPTGAGVIDTTNCAGWLVHDCFFTSAGIAVQAGGGDGLLNNCIFDQGLTGVVLTGQNNAVRNCLFYAFNYQIRVSSNAYDCEIENCHFEYAQYSSIALDNGSSNIFNLSVSDCKFVQNVQYGTHLGSIYVQGTGADVRVSDCAFRNIYGYGIAYGGGFSHQLVVTGCLFEGLKSNPGYAQSTTMGGVEASQMNVSIVGGNVFRNLPGTPINMGGTQGSTLDIDGARFLSNTGGTYDIVITNNNAFSIAYISNCRSSRATMLQPQATVPVFAPRVLTGQATLVAGTVTIAQALVRASSKITVSRQTDGGTVGASYSITRTAGTSFTITAKDGAGATQAADTSVVNWTLELAGV